MKKVNVFPCKRFENLYFVWDTILYDNKCKDKVWEMKVKLESRYDWKINWEIKKLVINCIRS